MALHLPAPQNPESQQIQQMSQLQQQVPMKSQAQAPRGDGPGCGPMQPQMNCPSGNVPQLDLMQQQQQQQLGNMPHGSAPQNPGQPDNQQWGLMLWAFGKPPEDGQMQQHNGNQSSGLMGGVNNPNLSSAQIQQQMPMTQQQQQVPLNNVGGNSQQQGQPGVWNQTGSQQGMPSQQQALMPNHMMGNCSNPNSMMAVTQGQQSQLPQMMGSDQQQQSQGGGGGAPADINQMLLQQQAIIQQLHEKLNQMKGGGTNSAGDLSSSALQSQQQPVGQQITVMQGSGMQQQMPMMTMMQQQKGNNIVKSDQMNIKGLLNVQGTPQPQSSSQVPEQMGNPAGLASPFLRGSNGVSGNLNIAGNAVNAVTANAPKGKLQSLAQQQDLSQAKGPDIRGRQQPFLDGSFAGVWQSNADLPDRRRIIFSIVKAIERMRPDASKMLQK